MLRVGRGRRDLGIALGGADPFLRKRRSVVEMDQIVRDARMMRLALEDRFQDGRALALVGIGLVVGRGRDVERDGVKYLRFVVGRIALRQRLHRLQIRLHPRAMGDLVVIGIEHQQRIDEIALAVGLGADRLRLLNGGQTERQIGCRRRGVRVVEQAERDAPIRDPAFRIGLERLLEYLLGFAIPERMLVSHGPVEPPLRRLVARRGEMNGPESLVGFVLAGRRRSRRNPGRGRNGHGRRD